MHIHLVDGTFELFRAFYGPPGALHEGREVGATRAFFRSMASLLREVDVTHTAVAFDTRIESFRNDLFDGYKTGEGIDEDLHAQFPYVELAAKALGMGVWSMIDFEADDGMCAGAHNLKGHKDVEHVWLCSPDKDLYQCIDGNVTVRDRMRKKDIDAAAVSEKFGIEPYQIADFLALVGDSADGIPGIPRWGQKSTSSVLQRYGALEKIPENLEDWDIKVRGAKGLLDNLNAEREEASLYKVLATLRTDATPAAQNPAEIRWKGSDESAFEEYVSITGDERAREIMATTNKAMEAKLS